MAIQRRKVFYIQDHANCKPGDCGSCHNVACGIYQGFDSAVIVESYEEYDDETEEVTRPEDNEFLYYDTKALLFNMSRQDLARVYKYIKSEWPDLKPYSGTIDEI